MVPMYAVHAFPPVQYVVTESSNDASIALWKQNIISLHLSVNLKLCLCAVTLICVTVWVSKKKNHSL